MSKDTNHSYRIEVPAEFSAAFSHFYFAQNTSAAAIHQTLLPSYQTIMVFNFGTPVSFVTRHNDAIEIDKCLVIGPIKQAIDYTLPPGSEILVANFIDDAFFRFFGTAPIAGQCALNPDDLLNENCFTALWNELNKINDTSNRVNFMLDFCKPYLQHRDPIAIQIAGFDDNNQSPIKVISEKNDMTERSIQLHHKKQLGYSAKELGRYQRFLKAIQLIQTIAANDTKMDWFEIISECGYYDQSQLIHDFKHYLNLTPSKYLKFQEGICNPRG
ncbi:DNA-binding protein [Niastella vici]|uniref:DNA-binding protein n=1 Tax=Niastella vici TaxID=1703345 RepID=A0A1V9FUK2_9BACT|nr:helix-turn-helix domain-containing protein [Niastella vici]OQP62024.1 DNA-binding protein [Niastella vici]